MNIRSWDLRRSSSSPELLKDEQPDWLFIHQPHAMSSHHSNGATPTRTRRRIAAMIKAQIEHGGHFAMYGSPVSPNWDVQQSPELAECLEDWYLTELR